MHFHCKVKNFHLLFSLPRGYHPRDLCYDLYLHFQRFGAIVAIKASIDSENRPSCFIEFETEAEFLNALNQSDGQIILNRPIRVEAAQCQKKIQIKIRKDQNEDILPGLPSTLKRLLKQKDIKMDMEENTNIKNMFQAILKFLNARDSCKAFEILSQFLGANCIQGSWEIDWVSAPNMLQYVLQRINQQHSIHQVQLNQYDGDRIHYASPYLNEYSASYGIHWINVPNYQNQWASGLPEQISTCQNSSVEIKYDENRTVFIGRLNSREVTEKALMTILQAYGNVERMQIFYNVIGHSREIMDAHAIVMFAAREQAANCINDLNEKIIFGATVGCTWFQTSRHNSNALDNSTVFIYRNHFNCNIPSTDAMHSYNGNHSQ